MNATAERLRVLRTRVEGIRQTASRRLTAGSSGPQIASMISLETDELIRTLFDEALAEHPKDVRAAIARESAIIAIGGSGRGDTAPYSDVDLLFLNRSVPEQYARVVAQVVRDSWDAGLKLGHSVRTLPDALRMARQDIQFATSLVDVRCLWGSASLVEELHRKFRQQVVQPRKRQFIDDCVISREAERAQHGAAVLQLEPDLKRSFGGLRDLHLLRWIGYARYGLSDIDSLKLHGALTIDDARRLVMAHEYLTSIRVALHLQAGRPQDVLTRDEQLRIAEERGVVGASGQRPVERFMQEYFQHSLAIADISSRFTARYRQHPMLQQVAGFMMSYRVDNIYRVGPDHLDISRNQRQAACRSLESVLDIYRTAQLHGVMPAPALNDLIKASAAQFSDHDLSPAAIKVFLEILGRPTQLATVLRSMYDSGVLERILPALRHIRCLLQFNQYHSYTVDEHTLRAVGCAESFLDDAGPLGHVYREIHHKELLHLALLLHDAGKGYDEDHSEVGKRLAEAAAERLGLTEHERDLLVFLVHRHLLMATLAFRRDISDPEVLLNFNHEVGSPEALQMLYVLTAADISAVGPGVWTDWKAELLTLFYDRSMIWLSGKSYLLEEPVRAQRVITDVLESPLLEGQDTQTHYKRLKFAPPHYLLATRPERIAKDLITILQRDPQDITVESRYDAETDTVEYRVITSESIGVGFFHKLTGVLSAKRMEILNAQICTYPDGIVIDSFRVHDYDHEGVVPEFRQEEVAELLRKALRNEIDVDALFRTRRRFAPNVQTGPVSNLPMRVVVDNESSDRCTVIDVFAHDRPGLLYRIARTLVQLELSVVLAKISTHFDQVVDVFYVTDPRGRKIADGHELRAIRETLTTEIVQFEAQVDLVSAPA